MLGKSNSALLLNIPHYRANNSLIGKKSLNVSAILQKKTPIKKNQKTNSQNNIPHRKNPIYNSAKSNKRNEISPTKLIKQNTNNTSQITRNNTSSCNESNPSFSKTKKDMVKNTRNARNELINYSKYVKTECSKGKENSSILNELLVDSNKHIMKEKNSGEKKVVGTFNDLKNNLLNKQKQKPISENTNPNKLKENEKYSPFNKINGFNQLPTLLFLYEKNPVKFNESEKISKEKDYQMKRYRFLKNYKYSLNPILRAKKISIIQKWWRKKIHPKIDRRNKAIRIQSYFRKYLSIIKVFKPLLLLKNTIDFKNLLNKLIEKKLNDFLKKIDFLIKINTLKKIITKVDKRLNHYLLLLALKKWKNNTYEQTIRNSKLLQKFLREQYRKKISKDSKKKIVLLILIQKLHQNNMFMVKNALNEWNKKSKLINIIDKTIIIQSFYQSFRTRTNIKMILAKKKLKNIFQRIIFKYISDLIKKLGDLKIRNIQIKTILYLLLRKKHNKEQSLTIEKCLNKWKNIYNCSIKSAILIENFYRFKKANKEKERQKLIRKFLNKYFRKLDKNNYNIKKTAINKWRHINKKIKCEENCRIIQEYLRRKLKKSLENKFKKIIRNLSKKKIYHSFILLSEINILFHSINQPYLSKFLNNMKIISKSSKIKEKLSDCIINVDKRKNNFLLRNALIKWNNKANTITKEKNNSALLIQNLFRFHRSHKIYKRLYLINKKLRKIILLKNNLIQNTLKSAFIQWSLLSKKQSLVNNSKKIQNYCSKLSKRISQNNLRNKNNKLKRGLDILLNIKFGSKNIFEKIQSQKNRNIFNLFLKQLTKNRLNTLKDCFSLIKKESFNNGVNDLFFICDGNWKKNLKKYFDKWKNNVYEIKKNESAFLLQKNMRIYIQYKKQFRKGYKLKKLVRKIYSKIKNRLIEILTKWNNKTKQIKNNICKKRIAQYFQNRYKLEKARKKWEKIVTNLSNRKKKKDKEVLLKLLSQYMILSKFNKALIKKGKKLTLDKLINNNNQLKSIDLLGEYILKKNDSDNKKILYNYIKKWNNNSEKLKNREDKLFDMIDIIDKKNIILDSEVYTNASLIKKIFYSLPIAYKKIFVEKLNDCGKEKHNYNSLSNNLAEYQNYYRSLNNDHLLKQIYRIYCFLKIKNLFIICENILKNKSKKLYEKKFISRLLINKKKQSEYHYQKYSIYSGKVKCYKICLKKTIYSQNGNGIQLLQDKINYMKYLVPYFLNFINRRILIRKEDTMEKLIFYYSSVKFCSFYKKNINSLVLLSENELIDNLLSKAINKKKFYELICKKFAYEISICLEKNNRIYNLLNLIKKIQKLKEQSKRNFIHLILLKWLFITFAKRITHEKLLSMFQNLQVAFLKAPQEFYIDENNNNETSDKRKKYNKKNKSIGKNISSENIFFKKTHLTFKQSIENFNTLKSLNRKKKRSIKSFIENFENKNYYPNIRKIGFYNERLIPSLVNLFNMLKKEKYKLVFASLRKIQKNSIFCSLYKNSVQKEMMKKSRIKYIELMFCYYLLKKMIEYMKKIGIKNIYKFLIELKKSIQLTKLLVLISKYYRISNLKNNIKIIRAWRIYIILGGNYDNKKKVKFFRIRGKNNSSILERINVKEKNIIKEKLKMPDKELEEYLLCNKIDMSLVKTNKNNLFDYTSINNSLLLP